MKKKTHHPQTHSMSRLDFQQQNTTNFTICDATQSKQFLKPLTSTRIDHVDLDSYKILTSKHRSRIRANEYSSQRSSQHMNIDLNPQIFLSDQDQNSKNARKVRAQIDQPSPSSNQLSVKSIHQTSLHVMSQKKRFAIAGMQVDSESERFFETQKLQKLYVKHFTESNPDLAIQTLTELLIKFTYRNNIIGFLKTYRLIADTYIKFNQKTNGLNVLIQLTYLCDLLHEVPLVFEEIKPQILLQMAKIAQDCNILDCAQSLTKKALQYAWHYGNVTLELSCFDKLGQISYLNQNLQKAIYYHNRCQWGRSEAKTSMNHNMATQNLKWSMQKLVKGINTIDGQFISKATFLPFYFSSIPQENEDIPNSGITNQYMITHKIHIAKQKHRFETHFASYVLLEQLMQGDEYTSYEMSTPRDEQKIENEISSDDKDKHFCLNPMEKFYYVLKDTADRQEKVYLENLKNRMRKFQGFVTPSRNSNLKWTYKLEQSMKKKPLQLLVNERVMDRWNLPVPQKVVKMGHLRVPIKDIIKISHLSPNRDLDQYGLSQVNISQPKNMFQKILS